MPKEKKKGLVWTLGFLLDQEATYLGHKATHLILDQVEFDLDQRRLSLSYVKAIHKSLTHWWEEKEEDEDGNGMYKNWNPNDITKTYWSNMNGININQW